MAGFGDIAAFFARPQLLQGALWGGLGLFTLALFAVMQKRWKHFSPLHKCTIFSVWGHFLLVIYATSVQIVAGRPGPGGGGDGRITVRLSADGTHDAQAMKDSPSERPAEERREADPTIPRTVTFAAARLRPPTTAQVETPPQVAPAAKPQAMSVAAAKTPAVTVAASTSTPQMRQAVTTPLPAAAKSAVNDALAKHAPTAVPAALQEIALDASLADPSAVAARLSPPVVVPEPPPTPTVVTAEATGLSPIASVVPPSTDVAPTAPIVPEAVVEPFALPQLYQQRTAVDRDRIATAHGGSPQTEEAVNRALRWLAANQELDGRWNPTRFGAGQETQTLGQNRGGAGAKADTGITALALLAMLGAGHTHQRGDYRTTVGRGLEFITSSQHGDGNLAGQAEPYAFMYCHGMATLALSEALAMSGDARLRPSVERAIGYTLRAQNRATGGWRYRPYDQGDTSQLGWQLMALKSAELAGLDFPTSTRQGIERFVASVSSGPQNGLASYRPGEAVSRSMTAEALLVRQFLGQPRQTPAFDEAGNYLLGELPGAGQRNYYYWYYGTLAMYQLQGEHWRRWNDALTSQLLNAQAAAGENAGSWEPNDVWGGYGGRVYSTALATLCLEVYYRYLPLYVEAASNGGEMLRK